MQRFSYQEKTAITVNGNSLDLWTPKESGDGSVQFNVFMDKQGRKALLSNKGDSWWQLHKKEAVHCFYAQFWMGDYPDGSWCWAIRQCKSTGKFDICSIATDINPVGLSTAERWEEECKAYTPAATALV